MRVDTHLLNATPRQQHILQAAENASQGFCCLNSVENESLIGFLLGVQMEGLSQPLTILKQAFYEILPDEELLSAVSKYFQEVFYKEGTVLWNIGNVHVFLQHLFYTNHIE